MKSLEISEIECVNGGDFELGYEVGFAISEGILFLNGSGRQLGGWIYETLHNN